MEPDINQQILAELQKVRRLMRRSLITFLVLFSTFVAAAIWPVPSRDGAYAEANRAVRALDYRRAIQIAEKIAADHPQDYSAHEYLGKVYLYVGDLAKAEEAYSRAYALYASEAFSGILEDIRKTRSPPFSSPSVTPSPSPPAQPTPQP